MKMKNGVVMLQGVCGLSWISMAAVAAEVTSADASKYISKITVCRDVFCSADDDPKHGDPCSYDKNTSGKYAIYEEVGMQHDVNSIGIAVCMQTCDEGRTCWPKHAGSYNAQQCLDANCSRTNDLDNPDPKSGGGCLVESAAKNLWSYPNGEYVIYKQVLMSSGQKIGIAECRPSDFRE